MFPEGLAFRSRRGKQRYPRIHRQTIWKGFRGLELYPMSQSLGGRDLHVVEGLQI